MAKNQVVSIDIGTNAIKLVQLEQTASGMRLISAGIESYPRENAIEEIDDQTIHQTLQKVWKKVQGRKKPPVVLSISRLLVTSRRLTGIPAAARDDQLPNLVAIQAETELPFSPENAVYDYHNVRRGDKEVSVELIAARREAVQKQIDYLKSLGIVPSAVLPSTLAAGVLAGIQLDASAADGRTMVVDIGAGRTDLCMMRGSVLQFSRSFSVGGNQLTRPYQDESGSNFEVAENKKITSAALDQQSQMTTPAHEWVDRFVSELKRSIGAAKRELNSSDAEFVREIWLCGGGARIAGLADYIGNQLQIPTRLWNPLDAFKPLQLDVAEEMGDGQRLISQPIDNFSDTLAVALGLGVNALTQQITLDLLPREERARLTQAEKKQGMLTAITAGGVLLVGLALGGVTWSRSHQAKIEALDEEIRSIRRAESNAQKALVKNLALADFLTPRVSALDILREFSVRFFDRTKVAWTNFNISYLDELDKAKITFNIEASTNQEVTQMLSSMGQSGLFTNIKSGQITNVDRDKKQISQVQVTCNLASDAVRMFSQARYLNPEQKGKEAEVARDRKVGNEQNMATTNSRASEKSSKNNAQNEDR